MKRASFEDMNCGIAQCLEVIGEWWTPLIIRDLFFGVSRFDEFHERLGISRNILTERLGRLEELGVLARRRYQDHPPRYDYELTEKGRDLWRVMTAMSEWGARWESPQGAPLEMRHVTCGHVTPMVPTCAECGGVLELPEIRMVEGPGGGGALLRTRRAREREGAPE